MQDKLALAVPVSGVYGADGVRRSSVRDLEPGELCVVRSVADRPSHKARPGVKY
jgi:hypothetical protein